MKGKQNNEIIGRVSHEIGNAITIVNCSLNIIEKKYREIGKTIYYKTARGELDYMEKLIKDLLYYNRTTIINKTMANMVEVVENEVNIIKAVDWAHDLELIIKYDSPKDYYNMMLDTIKMKQLLINLIKNSSEAIVEQQKNNKGLEGRIEIDIYHRDKYVELNVRDNGGGIKKEHMENIFEPMVTYKIGGTGLGLSITREIVKAHGGTIELESIENGTVAKVLLPKI